MPIIILWIDEGDEAQFSAIANKSRHSSIQLCWMFIILFKWSNNNNNALQSQIMISGDAAASGQHFGNILSYELKILFLF